MRRRSIIVALAAAGVLAAAVIVALAATGEGGGCESSGYPSSPECVAREYVTRTDASKCELVAPALLEDLTGTRGAEARRRCAASVAASEAPDEVQVVEREQRGGAFVVELTVDGREGVVTLERAGGRWQITSFAE